MEDTRIEQARMALRVIFGVIPVAAGLDKFLNLLTHWEQYISPLATALLPVSGAVLMRAVGVVEITVGLMILTRWTKVGAYIAAAWLALIAINLVTMGRFFDIAARDVALAVCAFALARLEEAHAEARAPHHDTHSWAQAHG